jgi:hypothetical protein
MSEKVVNLADRLKQRQALATAIPPSAPASTRGDATFARDLMVNMFGRPQAEGEDPSAALIMIADGVEMALHSMQALQNAGKTTELMKVTDTYSDERLLSEMSNASEQDMKLRPHFFYALVASSRQRGHVGERDRAPKE